MDVFIISFPVFCSEQKDGQYKVPPYIYIYNIHNTYITIIYSFLIRTLGQQIQQQVASSSRFIILNLINVRERKWKMLKKVKIIS